MRVFDTPSQIPLSDITPWYLKNALFRPPLTMATENLVNLEKNAEVSPFKDEILASYSKQNFC